jgi:hypothetical protein
MGKNIYGYKVTPPNSTCKDFKYEVNKRYKHNDKIKLCDSGFHFCEKLIDCFSYYRFSPENKVFKITARGIIITDGNKSVTDDIEIIEELSWQEVLKLVNTGTGNTGYNNTGNGNSGDWNSGDWNSGDWNSGDENSGYRNSGDENSGYRNSGDENSGYRNSGDRNSGDWNSGDENSGYRNSGDRNSGYRNSGDGNSGDWNSGDWNSCDNSPGFFNTKKETIRIFNKDSGFTRKEFISQYTIPKCLYFNLTEWICMSNMTDKEKENHPGYEVSDGYLKTYTYKEAAQKSISRATEKEKEQIRALPNYDPDVFEEIFGIRI